MIIEKKYCILNDWQDSEYLEIIDNLEYINIRFKIGDTILNIYKSAIPGIIEALLKIQANCEEVDYEEIAGTLNNIENYIKKIMIKTLLKELEDQEYLYLLRKGDIETELE